MEKLQDYLTKEGWKKDWLQTKTDFNDLSVLTRRTLGLSHYGLPKFGEEMTSREFREFCFDSSALWFNNDEEFKTYMMTNKFPLGRAKIGFGRTARRYDDTHSFENSKLPNGISLAPIEIRNAYVSMKQ